MLRQAGGLGTRNPYTGLPEYGFWKDAWKAVTAPVRQVVKAVKQVAKSPIGKIALTVGLTMALGPIAAGYGIGTAGTAAIVGGGMAALSGGDIKDVLKGAAFGYIGGTVAPAISGYMPGAAGSVLNQGFTGAALGTGFGLAAGMSPAEALKAGAVGGLTAAGVGYGQQQGYLPGGQAGAPRTEAPIDAAGTTAGAPELSLAPVEGTGPVGTVGTASENLALSPTDKYSPYYTGEPVAPADNFLISNQQWDAVRGSPDYTPNLSAQSQYLIKNPTDYSLDTSPDYVQGRAAMPPWAGTGLQPPQPVSLSGYNAPAGGMGLSPNADLSRELLAPTDARAQPEPEPSFMDKDIGGVKDFYKENFATDRPAIQEGNEKAALEGNKAVTAYKERMQAAGIEPTAAGAQAAYDAAYQASAPGFFAQYGPMAGAALATTIAAGGFKEPPVDDTPVYDPYYTGTDYMRDNPQFFSGGLYDYRSRGDYDPYRETRYAGELGAATRGVVTPTGIMQARYSPDYGRRVRQQQYYSPFIGVAEPVMAAKGGSIREFPRKSGPINGPGTGTSDDIPAMLSDGEFVFTAKAVRNAGGGSRRKGAARMYKLMKSLEKGGMVKG